MWLNFIIFLYRNYASKSLSDNYKLYIDYTILEHLPAFPLFQRYRNMLAQSFKNFLKALLIYNLHTKQFTQSVQLNDLGYIQTSSHSLVKTFSSPPNPKEIPYPRDSLSLLFLSKPLQPQSTTDLLPVSMNCHVVDISYKWGHSDSPSPQHTSPYFK